MSNLFWGRQYSLLPFFNLFKTLTQADFDKAILDLKTRQLITLNESQIRLTRSGAEKKRQVVANMAPFQFAGIGLRTNVATIQSCLNLAVQITSEFAYQNRRYYPLQTSGRLMRFCKSWFITHKSSELPAAFQAELTQFLETLSEHEGDAFVSQFIGHDTYGLTDDQIAQVRGQTPFSWHLTKLHLFSAFITWACTENQESHPLCQHLVKPWVKTSPLAESSLATYHLFLGHNDLARVAQLRHIKLNTVKEHLLEAAILTPGFARTVLSTLAPVTYSKNDDYFAITPVAQWQFATVQQNESQITFFEFRLRQIEQLEKGG
ncbi:hypothetical protein ACLJJ6_04660 [Pediococcus siamensis]|uniref:hypothetical protein n=1 Tax=Pediococcus siamensis TaxID=381829 RepID=UPI0039A0B9BF